VNKAQRLVHPDQSTAQWAAMFVIPHGAPEGYEWFVALLVLVGPYFAVRNFMRVRR
jgi:hypothetical protein